MEALEAYLRHMYRVRSSGEGVAETSYYGTVEQLLKERPFHMDYIFVPMEWTLHAVEVGTFDDYAGKGLSDHVPMIVSASPKSRLGTPR